MKAMVSRVANGFILNDSIVIEVDEGMSEVEAFATLCNYLADHFGMIGSRNDQERFYAVVAPGDKHEDFTEAHADVVFGKVK